MCLCTLGSTTMARMYSRHVITKDGVLKSGTCCQFNVQTYLVREWHTEVSM